MPTVLLSLTAHWPPTTVHSVFILTPSFELYSFYGEWTAAHIPASEENEDVDGVALVRYFEGTKVAKAAGGGDEE